MKSNVEIILPVKNAEKSVGLAIESILQQTYKDFILHIIDDSSTDQSLAEINKFTDKRIKLTRRKHSLGLAENLNRAITDSNTKYIARMDADDIALPKRIKKQFEFLESHPEIAGVGTAIEFIRDNTKSKILTYPKTPEDIKSLLIFGNAMAHPTVMFKTKILKQNLYDTSFIKSQDYDLWSRISDKHNLANLDEVLLKYNVKQEQIDNYLTDEGQRWSNIVRQKNLIKLGIKTLSKNELKLHQHLSNTNLEPKTSINLVDSWLNKIILANKESQQINPKSLQDLIDKIWFNSFKIYKHYQPSDIFKIIQSNYFRNLPLDKKIQILKRYAYCMKNILV